MRRSKTPSLAIAYHTRGLAMSEPLSAPNVDTITSADTNAAPRGPRVTDAAVAATSDDLAIAGIGSM